MSITVDCFGMTDRGKVRRLNEDQFLIADLAKSMKVTQSSLPDEERHRKFGTHHGKLFVVADGMGGISGGEVASGIAVETITDYVLNTLPWFFRTKDGPEHDLENELKLAVEECQRNVAKVAAGCDLRRMGTTLTMAYLLWPKLYVVHAGDSRCYLFRDSLGHQITRDHTVAQQMIDHGVMGQEEAESSKWSHALWNCVGGGSDEITADVYRATLQPGDAVLLCSDGLTRYVEEAVIVKTLAEQPSAESACRALIDAANGAGGDDNITVIIVRLMPVTSTSDTAVDSALLQPAS